MEHENDTRVRLRRTKSETRAEEIQKAEQMVRKSQPDKPCHRPRDSLFSWSSGFDNFTGFVNWGFLLLGIGGIRLLLENFIKYGIRVDPWQWFLFLSGTYEGGEEHPSILLIIFGAMYVCMLYAVLFLKLWSYVQVNMWCRVNNRRKATSQGRMRRQSLSYNNLQSSTAKQNGEEVDDSKHEVDVAGTVLVQYPDNLTFRDLYYFILAPTLCYELNFPRTQRIRKRFLIKRILEVVVGCQVVMSLFQQWMVPCVKNSLVPFSNMDVAKASERLLKLAIPNHLVWLCFFYLTFHSLLNLVGELLHFADRNFYCDWWNAHNIDIFWRTWNMPVHRWAVRHLYIPIIEMGYKKNTASVTVFFISAFFHEYLVSVPLKTFKTWAFLGMMGQIPLSMISKKVEKHWGARWGNITVWASLIIGQPLCIMMYYHDYVITHFGENLIEDYSVV
ncbi:diacylglycerol O-acyltransferase 1 isoform X5 [Apis mellifera]|uniref:O-acyltransferase n=1 Tax=Apis mellifera TaxID=7460 RepID=A0A7M7IIQ1_APIME|nr:diacylglycerol O-acyltransferase 1 isoform X5 [Apis mellifera]|eukprot:XP_016771314.1 diacylglycerol O-acyltransferase 1 isoform X5 [Apis mellifera]